MATAVIVNLHAGGGAARRRWPAVAPLLEERLGPLAAHFTEGPGHATLVAHQLAGAGFDPLIAAGASRGCAPSGRWRSALWLAIAGVIQRMQPLLAERALKRAGQIDKHTRRSELSLAGVPSAC